MQPSPPVIVCGCPGGGTSLVAKMLRLAGLFMGADAGDIALRKYHESLCYKEVNRRILGAFGRKDGKDEETVRRTIAALDDVACLERLAAEIDRGRLAERFWGGPARAQPWGWKDPRNSITLPLWKRIHPDPRVVVIVKDVDDRPSQSFSGWWFREQGSAWLKGAFMRPPSLAADDAALYVDFGRTISQRDDFNRLLDYCGLPVLADSAFAALRERAAIES